MFYGVLCYMQQQGEKWCQMFLKKNNRSDENSELLIVVPKNINYLEQRFGENILEKNFAPVNLAETVCTFTWMLT